MVVTTVPSARKSMLPLPVSEPPLSPSMTHLPSSGSGAARTAALRQDVNQLAARHEATQKNKGPTRGYLMMRRTRHVPPCSASVSVTDRWVGRDLDRRQWRC